MAISGVKRAFAEGAADRPKPRTELQPSVGVFDRRSYRRIAADFVLEVREVKGDEDRLDAVREQVRNLSKGGVFVEAERPIPAGSVVRMSFRLSRSAEPTHAIGVVRWTSQSDVSRGMGIQFVKVGMASDGAVERYVNEHAEESIRRDLSRTPLHRAFLRLHSARQGDAMRVGEIAGRLGATPADVSLVLRAFASHGLVNLVGDVVEFAPPEPEDRELVRALEAVLAENGKT
jgi:uncharacterized protein (TIGR02266 family)